MGLSTGHEKLDGMANTSRMTSYQRREQLIEIGRSLFAAKGFEAVSVEEIAATAKVSKPIVYEHFGGKEGLYAVVVDREMRALTDVLINALSDPQAHPRQIVERTALALLTYVEENAEGFRVLTRDSPKTDPSNSFNSLLGDIAVRVEDILTDAFQTPASAGQKRAVLRADAHRHDRVHLPILGRPTQAQQGAARRAYREPGMVWAEPHGSQAGTALRKRKGRPRGGKAGRAGSEGDRQAGEAGQEGREIAGEGGCCGR